MLRIVACSLVLSTLSATQAAAARPELIADTAANRHGLTRSWFAQAQIDPGRSRVQHVVLDGGTLFVQSDRAMVHAIDAESGQTLWARMIGKPNHPSVRLGVSRDLVVVVNGSRLYAVNRQNGDLLYETQVGNVPGAGPAVSEQRAYVPMLTGLIVSYSLKPMTDPTKELGTAKPEAEMTEEEKAEAAIRRKENLRLRQEFIPPLVCPSTGKVFIEPIVLRQNADEELVAWVTDRGFLHVGKVDRRSEDALVMSFRFEAPGGVLARPACAPPDDPTSGAEAGTVFFAARDGYVHALNDKTGASLWRYSTGEPIDQAPVAIDDRLYIATQFGGLHCLDIKSGRQVWWAPNVTQFVAAGAERVYAADKLGRLLVLSAKSGMRLDSVAVGNQAFKVANAETDRIYLVGDTGLVQMLREVENGKPVQHNRAARASEAPPPAEQRGIDEVAPAKKPAGKPPAEKDPADQPDNPFAGPAKPAPKAPAKPAPKAPDDGGAAPPADPAPAPAKPPAKAPDDPFAP